ncbi:HECT E3 ubiquitin ligase [Phytophthora palmivora]|uniref:HECT E3 ubiquitin ligase n=1 Tax=Phytophthora palmivora TaxID=4796 RepID=A0A2P4WYR6_9STRA|nr:HECT E3 ubiquitin ligase [Phytophthora palmivora]
MKMHAKRKAILDVVFIGEKGYGSGVTAAFYSTTAHALQMVTENEKNRYWVPGEDDNEVPRVDGVDVDDIADDAVVRHSNGLFPYPHRTPTPKLIERFRMMGRLAGKALMDERLLPLPLSPQFMKLVVGESFGIEEVADIFLSHGRILYSMYKASKKLIAGEQHVQIDRIDVQDWLDAVGFTFIDPFSQEPLVIDGENIAVTTNNLMLYVRAVLEMWLDSGIHAQVLAFREGISDVLPLGKLRLLFVPELLSLLCGEEDIKWDMESLMKDTKLAHGYTKDSQPVQFFFEVLDEMSVTERRSFLLYATGCPNLPPGGFQALKPPFEVVRRVVDNLDVDRALPFARTCTNTLHLPAYSSKAVLAKQMAFAIANSRGVIDRD